MDPTKGEGTGQTPAAPVVQGEKPAEQKPADQQAAKPAEQAAKSAEQSKEEAPKGGGEKPAQEGQVAKPVEISIEVPKGVPVNEEHVKAYSKLAGEIGLTADQARKVADFQFGLLKQAADDGAATTKKYEEHCIKALQQDPDFGGKNYEKNVEIAKLALVRFGSQALFDELVRLGLGSHPGIIKMMHSVGNAIKEDGASPRGGPVPVVETPQQAERRRYPNSPGMFQG